MHFNFRKANINDLDLLLEWRNDPLTRNNSLQTNLINKNDHEAWLQRTLQNQNRMLFIAELANTPVGTVRFDLEGPAWEISWTVAPDARKKKIGKEMVKASLDLISGDFIAKIKNTNGASISIAKHCGFVEISKIDDMLNFFLKT